MSVRERLDSAHVLALNVGSSSLKYDLALVVNGRVAASSVKGSVTEFGRRASVSETIAGCAPQTRRANVSSLEHAVVLACLRASTVAHELGLPIDAVAHRIVHGGTKFVQPTRLGTAELRELARLSPLAPLHQPQSLQAVRVAARAFSPRLPQIGVFDTAFHATLPELAWRYPIPRKLADRFSLRRFGFHGLAFESVLSELPTLANVPLHRLRAILFHLGSGCSACAIRNGTSVDTSMGLTPLDGLMMRTRSGSVDPSLLLHLARAARVTPEAAVRLLSSESGLLGIAGRDGDVRVLLQHERTDPAARVALAMFVDRLKKQLGAYLATLGEVDVIAFSGGIGENSPTIRARVLAGLETLGIRVDARANANPQRYGGRITARGSRIAAFVVAANEGNELARHALRALER